MRAAWYEKQGPPAESLVVGDMPEPTPGPGEMRIRVAASGVNPGDVKKRQDTFGVGMPYPRVVPHSDGAGVVDQVGDGVDSRWIGARFALADIAEAHAHIEERKGPGRVVITI